MNIRHSGAIPCRHASADDFTGHWHRASQTVAMTHIAVQESLDGKVVGWMEKVSDEQHRG